MKTRARLALAGMLLLAAIPARAGEVKVSFSNGLVTIVATDATPRQILAEWAKLGQVRITNLERLAGGPLTLQLTNVTESQALETLLRGTAGYVAAPRAQAPAAGTLAVSRYDRLLLMPGTAPAVPSGGAPAASQPPAMNRGRPILPTYEPDPDDDQPEAPRMMPGGPQRQQGGAMAPGQSFTPGQVIMPGQSVAPGQVISPGQYGSQASPYQPTGGSTGGSPSYQSTPSQPPQPQPQTVPGPARQITNYPAPAAAGPSVPGMPTAPITIPTSPYSNAGPPATIEPAMPQTAGAAVPGQATTSTTRPGEVTAPTEEQWRNPYGLPEPIRPPVVDPNANPYGLPNPVRTPATAAPATTPGATTGGATKPGTTTTTTGPIKNTPGGEG